MAAAKGARSKTRGAGQPKRGPLPKFVGKPCSIKLTAEQLRRIAALNGLTPSMAQSDVVRALLDIALPVAEERPGALWEPAASRKARSA